jgi:hypothetical protein
MNTGHWFVVGNKIILLIGPSPPLEPLFIFLLPITQHHRLGKLVKVRGLFRPTVWEVQIMGPYLVMVFWLAESQGDTGIIRDRVSTPS